MRWIKRLLQLLVALCVVLPVVAGFMPDHAHAERSIVIDRPPAMVFGVINSFRRFNDWSPWAKLDPDAKYQRGGPDEGVGAHFSWKGNNKVGAGRQEIRRSEAYTLVQSALDFGPMGQGMSTFTLVSKGQGTQLTWAFDSQLPLAFNRDFLWNTMGRLLSPWIRAEVGKDYGRGLDSLKALLESIPTADIAHLEADVGAVSARPTYYISTQATLDIAATHRALIDAYGEISAFATLNALQQAGPPRAVITGQDANHWMFDAAIPYDRSDAPTAGRLHIGTTHAGNVVLFKHVGSHATLADTHAMAHTWLAAHGWKEIGQRSEIYVSDPMNTPEDQLLTIIEVPVEP